MVCAPALLIGALLTFGVPNAQIDGIMSTVFMAGWICSNIGMQRMQATGTGGWGRAVLLIQLTGLVLAFLFGFFETTEILDENNLIFIVTDASWPLSMVWMLVVGVTVIVAKRLCGWWRFVPLLCPFWLPISVVFSLLFGGTVGLIFGFGLTAIFWVLLGYVVMRSDELLRSSPTPGYTRP